MSSASEDSIHIVADIGGTNARFAYVKEADARLLGLQKFSCAEFERLDDLVNAYLMHLQDQGAPKVGSICMAVAASVHDTPIKLTNRDWFVNPPALGQALGVPVRVLNDFAAQAWYLTRIRPEEQDWLQMPEGFGRKTASPACRTIAGPGTGFGAATLTAGLEVIESEPGHCSFAPVTAHEMDLLKLLWQRFGRVSIEHVLSGPGLANLFWANARLGGSEIMLEAPQVVARARAAVPGASDPATQAVRDFSALAGSVCGDIALAMGSRGGLYLSGDMLEKMGDLFDQALFIERFSQKGPFSQWCAQVPVARIHTSDVGLLGCAAYVAHHAAGIHEQGAAR